MNIEEKTKGFTLLEMLISLVIVVVGVLGVFTAVSRFSENTQQEKENLVASYLCQEGIEIVKNIRDSNWTSGIGAWDNGLTAGSYEADYIDYLTSLALTTSYTGINLCIEESTGRYKYITDCGVSDGNTKTSFKRRITLTSITDGLDIAVTVYWDNDSKSMTVREKIYNWR